MLALQIAVQANVPAIVWGPPGVGKTAFVEALGESLALPVETVIISESEPTDFGGIPFPQDGVMCRAPADWAMRLITAKKGILFLDEYSCGAPTVQKATMRTVRSRYVGGQKLPDDVRIVLAANPPEQAADGYDLPPPAANRLCHLTWPFEAIGWTEAAVAGFPPPRIVKLAEGWRSQRAHYLSQVAAFIRKRTDLALKLPKDEVAQGLAWPSPRTWDMAALLMAACEGAAAEGEKAVEASKSLLISGCVGEGAALEFLNWLKEQDLPDPEVLLAHPESFKLPERGDRAYAVLASVVAAVANRNDPKRWTAACEVLGVAAKAGCPDVAAAAARSLMPLQPKTAKIPASFQAVYPVVSAAGMLKGAKS